MAKELANVSAPTSDEPTREVAGSPAGTDAFLTRGDVATILSVSIATIRRLQGKELHPQRDEAGVYLFDPVEVEALRSRRPPPPEAQPCSEPGEVAAEAFTMFRSGVDVRDVVISLRRCPAEIAALYVQWERMGDAMVISDKVHGQLRRMVAHHLLPQELLTAIEDDDAVALQDYLAKIGRCNRRSST